MSMNRPFRPTRATVSNGNYGALTLSEIQGPGRKSFPQLCKVHRWRESRYYRTCTRCGFVEDKERRGL
jgi:hypothetical protein